VTLITKEQEPAARSASASALEESMTELSSRERELVALGAALASNCVPCIEYRVPAARKAGLSDSQIEEAIRLAEKVRQVPARMVLESALARVAGGSPATAGCDCDAQTARGGGKRGCAG
jgi:4-carboxymuconolactone decarboxylase